MTNFSLSTQISLMCFLESRLLQATIAGTSSLFSLSSSERKSTRRSHQEIKNNPNISAIFEESSSPSHQAPTPSPTAPKEGTAELEFVLHAPLTPGRVSDDDVEEERVRYFEMGGAEPWLY